MEMFSSAYEIWKKINYCLFIDTYKANEINIGMNEMRVNDSEMSRP